jgi:hypothetical protein
MLCAAISANAAGDEESEETPKPETFLDYSWV